MSDHKMKRLASASIALLLCAAFPCQAASTGSPSSTEPGSSSAKFNPSTAAVNWTPLIMKPTVSPRPFRGSEGQTNLAYELVLNCFASTPVELESFKVIDGKNPYRVLLSLDGKENITPFLSKVGDKSRTAVIKPGQNAILWINLAVDRAEDVPSHLVHQLSFKSRYPEKKKAETITCSAPDLPVDFTPPVVIGPPLKGGRWVASGGYIGSTGHRRALFPIDSRLANAQRFAIDWVLLDKEDRTTAGDSKSVSNSACYGQEVIAVADGTVAGVNDRFPNQVPYHQSPERDFPGGNTIVIRLPGGNYAFYAHLQPGSIKVKEGDYVKRGQVIGLVGNSGNSSGPHLHFHVMDSPYILGSNGVPYVFDSFALNERVSDMDKLFQNDEKGRSQTELLTKLPEAGIHNLELVRDSHIVTFPGDVVKTADSQTEKKPRPSKRSN